MDNQHSDILIIGAGMAGLSCAVRLAGAGRDVRVLDKGRGPGGRMAARRAEIDGETVSFDHGAQFFTARDPRFQSTIEQWQKHGVVARWPEADTGEDKAWVGTPGMNGPIRAMAEGLDVRWGVRAMNISQLNGEYRVDAGDAVYSANIVLIAVPAEQASDLLTDIAPELLSVPAQVESEPCWAVMAGFAHPLPIASDCVADPDARIAWAARNSAKPGRTGVECWVLHASANRSAELIDLPKEEVGPILLKDFADQTGAIVGDPIHVTAHRWLYAKPAAATGEPARFDANAQIGIAGDYLHSPRVEGAWISGVALADAVLGSQSLSP
ncbi:MAG: FAD-dependent oxidoreductase [Erythrobacter sp.]